jgi:hypothetical protein
MHDHRPLARRRPRNEKREQWRLAKIRQRARERKHEKLYKVRAGEVVLDAVVARSIDGGLAAEAAERDSLDPRKVSVDLSDILTQWALNYLKERKCQA